MNEFKIEALALRSVIRLTRIDLARVEKDLWRERHNHASVMLTAAKAKLVEAEKDNSPIFATGGVMMDPAKPGSDRTVIEVKVPVGLQYRNRTAERVVIHWALENGFEAKPHPEADGWWMYRRVGAHTWFNMPLPQAILDMNPMKGK